MAVKKICEKKIGNITYELKHFEGDNKYVIYRLDEEIMEDAQVHRIPEEAVFDNEKDARNYLEKLKNKQSFELIINPGVIRWSSDTTGQVYGMSEGK